MERKWIDLSQRLKATRKFYAPRLTPERLREVSETGRVVAREHNGEIIAFCALWPTEREEDWLELGTVWVSEEHRGNGLRHDIMAEALRLAPARANLLLITDVESVMRAAEQLGFVATTTETYQKNLSTPKLLALSLWASEVGVVCRLPDTIYPNFVREGESFWGKPEAGKRWLFIRMAEAHAT